MNDSVVDTRARLVERVRRLDSSLLAEAEHMLVELENKLPPAESTRRDWPHAPIHRLNEFGTYLVTAATLHKQPIFRGAEKLDLLETCLLSLARQYGWQLEAWAVFSNHYHFVGHLKNPAMNLQEVLTHLHADTARLVNQLDRTEGRRVWHNFWETRLTFETSYQARLHYVHQNAVKHGLVPTANQYRWCSAAWFERTATPAQVKTIYAFKIDQLKVIDDFDVEM